MAMATTGMSERAAVVNAPPRNLPIWRISVNVPSGKNTKDWPAAASIDSALVPIEAFDELRSQAPQQQAGEGHAHHFLLDHEGKIGRQRRGGDQAVDIAGVIGDDHAGYLRQPIQPLDAEWNSGGAQKGAREYPGHPPAPAQA